MASRAAITSFLGVLAVAAVARAGFELVPAAAQLQHEAALRANLQALNDDAVCQSRTTSCSADCGSLVRCAYVTDVWKQIATSPCPARTPYCTLSGGSASCTATPPATGAVCNPAPPEPLPANTFNCSADGYFPDVSSCTRYYLCVGSAAYRLDCSAFPGTVYDQRTTRCVPRSRASCYTLHCSRPNPSKAVEYHLYTPAPWIYAVCTDKDKALVGTCQSERLAVDANGECVEACSSEGRFRPLGAAATDTSSYVDCVDLGNGKWSAPTPGSCPTGTAFNEAAGQCVVP